MFQFKWTSLILLIFNGITIILFANPPVVTNSINRLLTLLYLISGLLLIYNGLKSGYSKASNKYSPDYRFNFNDKLLSYFFLFYIITLPVKYGYSLGYSPFDISGMISRLAIGIANPALGYSLKGAATSVPWSVYFIITAIGQFFFTISFCKWKLLTLFYKLLVIMLAIIEVLFWLGIGTSFGVVMLLTNMIFSLLASIDINNKTHKKINRKLLTFLLCALTASMLVFSRNIIGRTGGGDSSSTLAEASRIYDIDYDNLIVKHLPQGVLGPYIYTYSYLCQGYENLGLAFNCDFTWTRFVGSTKATMYLSEWVFNYDAMEDSYLRELEKMYNIDPLISWHSAYTWFANDFTFAGALLLIYLIAYCCGFSLSLSVRNKDLISMIVFVVFANTILFIFANTNYLTNCFNSFLFVFPYWVITRLRIIKVIR